MDMATTVGTIGKGRAASGRDALGVRLGAALNGVLERWGKTPELICGDADSSLLAIARDLQLEDRLLCRRFGR
jgi:hypothetical protein